MGRPQAISAMVEHAVVGSLCPRLAASAPAVGRVVPQWFGALTRALATVSVVQGGRCRCLMAIRHRL